tara:strand:+ start:44 stop:622 length:579 start_codon:yes stop_codon:yes gene_type:complete
MSKKKLFQFVLIIFLFLLLFVFYKIFFIQKSQIGKIEIKNININNEIGTNIIENLKYVSKDVFGNLYVIQAKSAEILTKEEEVIQLVDVEASIKSENQETIFIVSSFADYNKINNNTIFRESVKIEYGNHLINSSMIKLNFQKNLIEILDNVHYRGLDTEIIADKVEIDLIKKNIKLSMNKESEEIFIKGKY